jgi:AraC-like DNA-binding protein
MDIQFRTYPVAPQLKGYIYKIWLFKSSQPMPNDDMKLVVPTGRLLMVMPFRNGLTGRKNGETYIAKTHTLALVGMSDCPSIVDAETNGPVGIIGVEFSSLGAYRFFHFNLNNIANRLYHLSDLLHPVAKELEATLQDSPDADDKIKILQQFLLSLYRKTEQDKLFEYCIHQIDSSDGNIRIKELERQTGYSSRWLNMKFENMLGMSPKNLGSILRFQKNYQAMISNPVGFFNQKDFFDHYHDESHFIKNFKRYTGYAPSKILQLKNEFGKTFYKD